MPQRGALFGKNHLLHFTKLHRLPNKQTKGLVPSKRIMTTQQVRKLKDPDKEIKEDFHKPCKRM